MLAYVQTNGKSGGVGDCPVATGDGGMPDSAAMMLTGVGDLGRGRWQGEGWRSVRLGRQWAGVRLTDGCVRAGLSALDARLSQYCHIARALSRPLASR